MPPGPIRGIRFVHKAIRVQADIVEQGCMALTERHPNGVTTFMFDHEEEAGRLDELDKLVDNCNTADELASLQRAAIAVNEHLDHHMLKEEQLLWPKTEELFTPPEQGAIVGAILAVIPPSEMPALVSWTTDLNPPDEAEAYVRLLKMVQPPERFAMAVSWIKDGVKPERWADLTSRIPELA